VCAPKPYALKHKRLLLLLPLPLCCKALLEHELLPLGGGAAGGAPVHTTAWTQHPAVSLQAPWRAAPEHARRQQRRQQPQPIGPQRHPQRRQQPLPPADPRACLRPSAAPWLHQRRPGQRWARVQLLHAPLPAPSGPWLPRRVRQGRPGGQRRAAAAAPTAAAGSSMRAAAAAAAAAARAATTAGMMGRAQALAGGRAAAVAAAVRAQILARAQAQRTRRGW
jgi:hypothetical protein